MCVCACLYVEPVWKSKDYVWSRIKIGSVICLNTPVSPSVPEMKWNLYATGGNPFLRMYLWLSLCTLYLLPCQVELAIQVCCCVLCLLSAVKSLCRMVKILTCAFMNFVLACAGLRGPQQALGIEHLRFFFPPRRQTSNLARESGALEESVSIGSSTEKGCRLHSQYWTDDLSQAWERRRRRERE